MGSKSAGNHAFSCFSSRIMGFLMIPLHFPFIESTEWCYRLSDAIFSLVEGYWKAPSCRAASFSGSHPGNLIHLAQRQVSNFAALEYVILLRGFDTVPRGVSGRFFSFYPPEKIWICHGIFAPNLLESNVNPGIESPHSTVRDTNFESRLMSIVTILWLSHGYPREFDTQTHR